RLVSAGSYPFCWTIGFCWSHYGSAGSRNSPASLPAGCSVSAGSYGFCCCFRVHDGGHPSAGGFIYAVRVVIQTIQAGLRESYECLASVPIACTTRQMVFSSPWLTAKKESGSPLQTDIGAKGLTSPEQTATGKGISNPLMAVMVCQKPYDCKLLIQDFAASFDSAVHRVHAGSFDAAVASLVSAACVDAAAYFVPAALQSSCFEKIYREPI
ncbi:hypothetical protein Tco_1240567, partial [Tanacetum coccineum]